MSRGNVTLEESTLADTKVTRLAADPHFTAKTYTALDVSDGLAKIGQNASANVTETNNTVATDASEQKIEQILRYRSPPSCRY